MKEKARRAAAFVKKHGARAATAVVTMAVSGLAAAQTSTPFDTAITDVTSKITTYGGALVGLAAVGVGFGVGIKYIKKIRGAA